MSTTSSAPRRRPRLNRILAGAAIASVTLGTLAVTTTAHAESGRRICEYSFKAKPRSFNDPLMRISLGMNYKKDGACPALDPARLAATGLADVDQIYPNPVPKWTCEDWGTTHETYKTDLGSDPCSHMLEDNIYAFYWQDPTTPNAKAPSYQDVAKKYAGDKTAEAKLIAKVKKGGSGTWGAIPMPPNAQVKDADIATLVKWILAGAK